MLPPADMDWISNGSERAAATAARLLVRFDAGRVRNGDRLTRATL